MNDNTTSMISNNLRNSKIVNGASFKLTVENVESMTESRPSLKRSNYQRSGDLDRKRVSFDVNNIK